MYTANLDNLFETFFANDLPKWKTTTTLDTPSGYLKQNNDSYEIALNVIGHSKDAISIDVDKTNLVITAKTPIGETIATSLMSDVNHTIKVPETFNLEKTSAIVENGILTITIPKKEETKIKKVSIKIQ